MNSDTPILTLPVSIDFTLSADGDLTSRFLPEKWPWKLTEEDATKLSQALGQMLKNQILRVNLAGLFYTSPRPILEAKTKVESLLSKSS